MPCTYLAHNDLGSMNVNVCLPLLLLASRTALNPNTLLAVGLVFVLRLFKVFVLV